MRALVAHLDTPLESGGDTQVIYVHNANAKDLVPILQGVASTLTGIAPPTATKARRSRRQRRPASHGDDPGARGDKLVDHQRAAGGVPLACRRCAPARRASRAGADRGSDRRNHADKIASEIGMQWQLPLKQTPTELGQRYRRHQFHRHRTATTSDRGSQNPLGVGNGFNLGYINGTITVGRERRSSNSVRWCSALQGDGKNEYSVDAVDTDARQSGSARSRSPRKCRS